MSLTNEIMQSQDSVELINNFIEKMCDSNVTELNKEQLWSLVSDKTYEQLKKTVKTKKKRAKTAYGMFSSDKTVRTNIKNASKDELTLGEMSKLVSEKWKTLSEEEKSVYEKMAQEKNDSEPVVVVKNKKPKKKTPYNLFLADKDVREKHKSVNPTYSMMEINKLMIAEWKNMNDKDKEKYVNLANKANEDLDIKSDNIKVEEVEEEVKKTVKKKTIKK